MPTLLGTFGTSPFPEPTEAATVSLKAGLSVAVSLVIAFQKILVSHDRVTVIVSLLILYNLMQKKCE